MKQTQPDCLPVPAALGVNPLIKNDMPENSPAAGKAAPKFKLAGSDGQTHDMKTHFGKSPVMDHFHSKADMPACTKEACGFRDAIADEPFIRVTCQLGSPDRIGQLIHRHLPQNQDSARFSGTWAEWSFPDPFRGPSDKCRPVVAPDAPGSEIEPHPMVGWRVRGPRGSPRKDRAIPRHP
jgi:hypothetical protein